MVWGDVKGYAGRENNTFKTDDVKHLIIKHMDNIQIRFTPIQVKINNDDTLLHN
jgi:regulatory protein YycH of two-component signal transduction system YycFG